MRLFHIKLAALVLAATPASAHYTCPHGQIYRISLRQCFTATSAMARAYAPRQVRLVRHADRSWSVEIVRPPPDIPLPSLELIPAVGSALDDEGLARLKLRGMLNQ
jgi:hypothetical protein